MLVHLRVAGPSELSPSIKIQLPRLANLPQLVFHKRNYYRAHRPSHLRHSGFERVQSHDCSSSHASSGTRRRRDRCSRHDRHSGPDSSLVRPHTNRPSSVRRVPQGRAPVQQRLGCVLFNLNRRSHPPAEHFLATAAALAFTAYLYTVFIVVSSRHFTFLRRELSQTRQYRDDSKRKHEQRSLESAWWNMVRSKLYHEGG